MPHRCGKRADVTTLNRYEMKREITVAKPELGEKVNCPECDVKFYDLTRNPATCPKCAHSFDPSTVARTIPSEVHDIEDDEAEDKAKANGDDEDEEDEEDEDDVAAKELELDGDDAALMTGGDEDEDDSGKSPDMDGFSTSDDDDDEDAALVDDDDDDDLPPTGDEDDDVEEIEI